MKPPVILIAILLALCSLVGCGGSDPSCGPNQEAYDGQCVSSSVVSFRKCTDGHGVTTTTEIGGSLPVAARLQVEGAYKRSRSEDRTFALEMQANCLKLVEQSATTAEDRNAARVYEQKAQHYVDVIRHDLPDISVQSTTIDCGPAQVDAAIPTRCPDITVNSIGTAPLEVTRLTPIGPNSSNFTFENGCDGQPIEPEHKCTIRVFFEPSDMGGAAPDERRTTLIIHQNLPAPDRGTRVNIVGTATGTGNGVSAAVHSLTVRLHSTLRPDQDLHATLRVTGSDLVCQDDHECTWLISGTSATVTITFDQPDGFVHWWTGCAEPGPKTCQVDLTNGDALISVEISRP